MADIYMERHEFTVAENHSQRALTFAKRYEGHKKTNLLFRAFSTCCAVRKMQEDYINALTYAEEAYNCVAIAFNPVHPMVQDAAGTLIECLTHKGDFYDALRFAEMTFSNLCDPANGLDQNSEAVAAGYYCLGNVISMQDGDHVKAERLARESYRIRVQIYGDDHYLVGSSIGLIANTLKGQDKLGDETKKLYERSLAIYTRNEGPDGVNTAFGNAVLGNYYVALSESQLTVETKKEHFMLAFGSYHEAVRITKKIYGTDHPKYIDNLDKLCIITHHIELLG
jgi:tetratricopeptide (TPR) repeat protein